MIELIELSEKHKNSLVKLLNNENVTKWLLVIPFPYTYADACEFINRCKENKNVKQNFAYAIEVNGKHVGGIGLHLKDIHSAEVGYWLGEEFWGNGYMTEALNKVLDFAFNDLKLVRVSAHIFEGNEDSEKLLLRCGFEYEGLLKKCHKKGEFFLNSKLFAKVVD